MALSRDGSGESRLGNRNQSALTGLGHAFWLLSVSPERIALDKLQTVDMVGFTEGKV